MWGSISSERLRQEAMLSTPLVLPFRGEQFRFECKAELLKTEPAPCS